MSREPFVWAHRGFSALYPENTLLSFNMALEAGADGVECDIQKTGDGEFVVIHDASIDRVSNGRGKVSAMTLKALKKLDLGRGEKILTLGEFLRCMPPEILLDIELKGETIQPEDCPEIYRILEDYGSNRDILISSFRLSLLFFFKKMQMRIAPIGGFLKSRDSFFDYFNIMFRLRPDFVKMPVKIFNVMGRIPALAVIKYFRCIKKIPLAFWTINSARDYALVKKHAFAVITDNTALFRKKSI